MRSRYGWLTLTLALALHGTAARGDEPPNDRGVRVGQNDAQAEELKRQGDALLLERRYADALVAYDASYARFANAAILYNRSRALQYLARYAEALESIERFDREASPDLRSKVPGLDEFVQELRSKVATLVVTSNARGGRVLVGGKDVGTIPLGEPIRTNAGRATIEIIADGYFPFRRDMALSGAIETRLVAKLVPRDMFGYLVVGSHVEGAMVFVDDTRIGLVTADTPLMPGTHSIRVVHEGYDGATAEVVIRVGDRSEIVLDPMKSQRSAPITSRWWFWAGVGAVVVGAIIVTAVVATTERSPPDGDFSPGRIRF